MKSRFLRGFCAGFIVALTLGVGVVFGLRQSIRSAPLEPTRLTELTEKAVEMAERAVTVAERMKLELEECQAQQ